MVAWSDLGKCTNVRCPDEGSCNSFYPKNGDEYSNPFPLMCHCGCRGNQHAEKGSVPFGPGGAPSAVPPPRHFPTVRLYNQVTCLIAHGLTFSQAAPSTTSTTFNSNSDTSYPTPTPTNPTPGPKATPVSFLGVSQERSRRQTQEAGHSSSGTGVNGSLPFNVSSQVCFFSSLISSLVKLLTHFSSTSSSGRAKPTKLPRRNKVSVPTPILQQHL